eukprot:TRINITY_DN9730_c0_g1_i4.p1 TRINITY_DN9730_c0_g1~~TRINITY_DN9730_c0_g1_i4.p1  ORF type:complete len:509 (+),score=77.14 TRINITY_DN9730_c0_g1_i4:79-1605(+)
MLSRLPVSSWPFKAPFFQGTQTQQPQAMMYAAPSPAASPGPGTILPPPGPGLPPPPPPLQPPPQQASANGSGTAVAADGTAAHGVKVDFDLPLTMQLAKAGADSKHLPAELSSLIEKSGLADEMFAFPPPVLLPQPGLAAQGTSEAPPPDEGCGDFEFLAVFAYSVRIGLLSLAWCVPAIAGLYVQAHWNKECYLELKTWLLVDGILTLVYALAAFCSLCCGGGPEPPKDGAADVGQEQAPPGMVKTKCSFNVFLCFLGFVSLIVGIVLFNTVPFTHALSTTTTTSTTLSGHIPIEVASDKLRRLFAMVLWAKGLTPLVVNNYVMCVMGGAGLMTGFLSIPAGFALCGAATMTDMDCNLPLRLWLLIDGLVFTLIPILWFCGAGLDKDLLVYAYVKQKAIESKRQDNFVMPPMEEKLNPCAHWVNTCICAPTLILFVIGAVFYFHSADDAYCSEDLHYWVGIVMAMKLAVPFLSCCNVEFCLTSSGIPGGCFVFDEVKHSYVANENMS